MSRDQTLFLRPATWISCLFILSPYRKKCRHRSYNRPQMFPSTFIIITLPFCFYFKISDWSFYFTRVKAVPFLFFSFLFFLFLYIHIYFFYYLWENSSKSRNDSCYKQILSHSYNPLHKVKVLVFALFPDNRKSAFFKDPQASSFCPSGKINV